MRSTNYTLTPTANFQSEDLTITEGSDTLYPMNYLLYNGTDGTVIIRLLDSDDDYTTYPNSYTGIVLQSGNEYPISGTTHVNSIEYKVGDATTGDITLSAFNYKKRG